MIINRAKYQPGVVAVFLLIHLVAIGAFLVPWHPALLGWLIATYAIRMFGVTAGTHAGTG